MPQPLNMSGPISDVGDPTRTLRRRDAAPQHVPRVRGHGVDLSLVAVERHRVGARVLHPEAGLETLGEAHRRLLLALGECRLAAPPARAGPSRAERGTRRPALRPARAAPRPGVRRPSGLASGESFQPWLTRPRADWRRYSTKPSPSMSPWRSIHAERCQRVRPQAVDQLAVGGPALVLPEQHQPQRGRVDRAVVGRVGDLTGQRQLTGAQLVEDLARLGIAPVVAARSPGAAPARSACRGRSAAGWQASGAP